MTSGTTITVLAALCVVLLIFLLFDTKPKEGFRFDNYYRRAPRAWSRRSRGYRPFRPFRYWTQYLAPSYYPNGGYYGYDLKEYFDPYDYTNDPDDGELCFANITIEDAFGPYTAGVMGKQAWLDWAGRNGFQKIYLDRSSVTNDHAIVDYVGACPRYQQRRPPKDKYQAHNATPQYY